MQIELTFPSGEAICYDRGIKIEDVLLDSEFKDIKDRIVAVKLANEIVSLAYRVTVNGAIEPILLNSPEGNQLYRKTLCFLLGIAAKQLFPDRRLVISHSLSEGFYYYFDRMAKINEKDLRLLYDKIQEIIAADEHIQHHVISYKEAITYFEMNNQPDTALFLKYQSQAKVPIYRCGEYIDLSHGPLLSRTGWLKYFEIRNHPPGFLLRFPPDASNPLIPSFIPNPLLFSIYQEYNSWGKILNMNCVGLLNQHINEGNIKEFIQVAEALHDKKIANISDIICEKRKNVHLILIAGPSSSGKTTFSKKLTIQLRVLGRNPVSISLDDYFLPRDETPLDEEGNLNLEALEAIDIELLNEHLVRLFRGEEVKIPHYDFVNGRRGENGKILQLPDRSVLILEGIHGLNDRLTPKIDRKQKFKIYVSALTQLNLDNHNRIRTADNRLIRRLVRDHKYRGNSALETLRMWPSVRKGEGDYIFPFQNSSDAVFNSALDYELAVLKIYVEPLLRTIKPDVSEYSEARRLLFFLYNFLPIPPNLVPPQSILREFIGESEFKY
jgi:uridine kinase